MLNGVVLHVRREFWRFWKRKTGLVKTAEVLIEARRITRQGNRSVQSRKICCEVSDECYNPVDQKTQPCLSKRKLAAKLLCGSEQLSSKQLVKSGHYWKGIRTKYFDFS